MHKTHSSLRAPDQNAKIWRYMDFQKFVSLLDKQALFFGKVQMLQDNYEGSLPIFTRLVKASMSKLYSNNNTSSNYVDDFLKLLKATTLVNTWHINDVESAAMWHLYSNNNAGIAIQSTYKRLSESFKNNKEDVVWISTVKYIDYNKDLSGLSNTFEAFTCKRLSFQHERELRAFTSLLGHRFMESLLDQNKKATRLHWPEKISKYDQEAYGKYIPIKLDSLIERIYLSPSSQDWHIDLVKSITKKYNINKEIIKSKLYSLH
jgi:Protein of unknown function (DUF2971)